MGRDTTPLLCIVAFLLLWGAAQWTQRRPPSLADDWGGHRQADTQAIARNFATDGLSVLYPRIDWGGAGPGYVEAEFQLYTAVTGSVMRWLGVHEWIGQLASLIFVGGAGLVAYLAMRRRFGDWPAFIGVAVFLTGRGATYLSTSVQPDTLAILFFVLAWTRFLVFLESEHRRHLVEATVATTLAALIKPTMLCLGVSQFLIVLMMRRHLLRRADLWLAWALVLATLGLFFLQAHSLYVEYGNTFGTVSGGDRKFPKFKHLLMLQPWMGLAKFTVLWGFGIPAVVAGAYLVVRRNLAPPELALGIGCLVMGVTAMRYTSSNGGTHYHIIEAALGAWLVAQATREIGASLPRMAVRFAIGGMVAFVGLQQLFFMRQAAQFRNDTAVIVGKALQPMATPGDLVIVRSDFPAYDEYWESVYNFEDPRIFYLANVRGWAIPADMTGFEEIARMSEQGARFYVEGHRRIYADPNQPGKVESSLRTYQDPELYRWLETHAVKRYESPAGRIWELSRRRQPGV